MEQRRVKRDERPLARRDPDRRVVVGRFGINHQLSPAECGIEEDHHRDLPPGSAWPVRVERPVTVGTVEPSAGVPDKARALAAAERHAAGRRQVATGRLEPRFDVGQRGRVDGPVVALGEADLGHEGAQVEDSIIMDHTTIGKGARIRRAIVDREIDTYDPYEREVLVWQR